MRAGKREAMGVVGRREKDELGGTVGVDCFIPGRF